MMPQRINSNDYEDEAAEGSHKPDERSGHIATMWAGHVFVIGGYSEVNKRSHFKQLTEVWYYNPFRKLWKSVTAKGIAPENACSGACAGVLGDDIILFGGFYRNVGHSDKLFRLSLKNARDKFEPEWSDITDDVEGNGPTKKDKFCSWTYGENSIMFFGGFGPPPPNSCVSGDFTIDEFSNEITRGYGWNNHLHMLKRHRSVENQPWRYTWSQPKYTGNVPSPRSAASTATVGDTVWMFGGQHKTTRVSDLHAFDLKSFAWRQVEVPDCGPIWRSCHAMAPVGDQNFVLHGGYDNGGDVLNDTWLYDTLHDTWTTIKRPSNPHLSLPRLWHTCTGLSDNEVLFFGGCEASVMEKNAKHLNSVFTLKVSPSSLQALCADVIRKYAFSENEMESNLRPSVRRQFSLETPRNDRNKTVHQTEIGNAVSAIPRHARISTCKGENVNQ